MLLLLLLSVPAVHLLRRALRAVNFANSYSLGNTTGFEAKKANEDRDCLEMLVNVQCREFRLKAFNKTDDKLTEQCFDITQFQNDYTIFWSKSSNYNHKIKINFDNQCQLNTD